MFWRMTGLSTASPVESILDKDNYTIEELLDEDEIIQECKALNTRLINFLRERTQVEQLLRYIVGEAPDDAEKKRTFKFPFIACEIFTCEVDIILKTLVEDEELMDLLFSFIKPDRSHSTLLAGYFSKVVICLMLRKTVPLMNYIQGHQDIFRRLVDLIGITSIMEVLLRLIGADEHMYSNYMDAMQWLEDMDILEMIVDKFSSSDTPEVHANAAEILCAITQYSPPGISAKITSPSFVGRLFHHALEESSPKSVLVHSLTICISLLDPKRMMPTFCHSFRGHMTHGSSVTANPETINVMLDKLGGLLMLLDISSSENVLPTTYGRLQPPLGTHRLKIVEFISVILMTGSEAAEEQLIQLGAVQRMLDLFFEYPFNNFLHHHVENIVVSCLESKRTSLIEHLLGCDIVQKILDAEKNSTLSTDSNKPTLPVEGRSPPRIGNIGHISRIANKLLQLGNNNSMLQAHFEDNRDWIYWHTNVLLKRNALEDVYKWTCGRPTALHDRNRDSDDEDFKDRDYDVAALANNLSQAFSYGIYGNDNIEEAHGSFQDDEDVYFDDGSAEVVISSLRLGDHQDSSSLFTNSNWFAFEDDRVIDERSTASHASPSPISDDEAVAGNCDLVDTATTSKVAETVMETKKPEVDSSENGPTKVSGDASRQSEFTECERPPEWVEWRETSDTCGLPGDSAQIPNNALQAGTDVETTDGVSSDVSEHMISAEGKVAVAEGPVELPSSSGVTDSPDGGQECSITPQTNNVNSDPDPSLVENVETVASQNAVNAVEP